MVPATLPISLERRATFDQTVPFGIDATADDRCEVLILRVYVPQLARDVS